MHTLEFKRGRPKGVKDKRKRKRRKKKMLVTGLGASALVGGGLSAAYIYNSRKNPTMKLEVYNPPKMGRGKFSGISNPKYSRKQKNTIISYNQRVEAGLQPSKAAEKMYQKALDSEAKKRRKRVGDAMSRGFRRTSNNRSTYVVKPKKVSKKATPLNLQKKKD